MGKPYQVVISPNCDFFLKSEEVIELASRNNRWAIGECSNLKKHTDISIPTEDELPRHSKALIAIADSIDRFEIVNLEVKIWPPKYAVVPFGLNRLGEQVIEPCTVPWKTVYYPQDYNQSELSEDEMALQKINSIAP